MKRGKRFLAALLSAGMIVTMMPEAVGAEELIEQPGYAAVEESVGAEDAESDITLPVMQNATITASNITKSYGDRAFYIKATADSGAKPTYDAGTNKNVATINTKGYVKIVGVGKTTVTITAPAKGDYFQAQKRITITVKKAAATVNLGKTSYTKVDGDKAFKLSYRKGNAPLSFASSNKKVVKVDSKGLVTIQGCGIAKITVTAKDKNHNAVSKKVTITVNPGKVKGISLKKLSSNKLEVVWSSRWEGSGYLIEYSTDKNFKKGVKKIDIKKAKTSSTTIKNITLSKGYYVRMRSYYKVSSSKKIYSTYSIRKFFKG